MWGVQERHVGSPGESGMSSSRQWHGTALMECHPPEEVSLALVFRAFMGLDS